MNCSINDLCEKDVINVKTGCRLGPVCDVELDTDSGRLVSIIIYGKNKLLNIGGRDEDIKVRWEDISVIGDDTILVCADNIRELPSKEKRKTWDGLFR